MSCMRSFKMPSVCVCGCGCDVARIDMSRLLQAHAQHNALASPPTLQLECGLYGPNQHALASARSLVVAYVSYDLRNGHPINTLLTPVIRRQAAAPGVHTIAVNYGASRLFQNFTFTVEGSLPAVSPCLAQSGVLPELRTAVLAEGKGGLLVNYAHVFRVLGEGCVRALGYASLWDVITAPHEYYSAFVHSDEAVALLDRHALHSDVIVDATGPTTGHRSSLIATLAESPSCSRHTPAVVGYLGYPGSFGMKSVGHVFVDAWTTPPEQQHLYYGNPAVLILLVRRKASGSVCFMH